MYQLVAKNFEQARKKRDTKVPVHDRKCGEGDSILLQDHSADVWDPRYTRDYQIVSFPGKTQVEVVDSKGKV